MAAILLLASPGSAGTVVEHVNAFVRWSRHDVFTWDPIARGDSRALRLSEFDVAVIHYSLLVTSEGHVPPRLRDQLRSFAGLKVQYVQDDYRQVDSIALAMRDLGVRILFCLVPPEQIEQVWSQARLPGVTKRTTLAGYVPEEVVGRTVRPAAERPLDVGYRGRDLPPWLGCLAREKARIGQEFLKRAAPFGLRCDVAWREQDRLYGEDWIRFLASCRATLGTESAVSIVDFDGTVESRARRYLAEHPRATDADIDRDVLAPFEGNVVLRVVSPRVFEAAALRTGLVLFPGSYSGVIEPWTHYVPLAVDFSNLPQVAQLVRSAAFVDELTQRAERDLVLSGRYSLRRMVREFEDAIEGEIGTHRPRTKVAFALARAETAQPARAATALWSLVRHMRTAVVMLCHAATAIAVSAALRGLVRHRFMSGLPGAPPWGRLTADLARLALLRRRRTRAPEDFRLRCELGEDGLRLESVPLAASAVDGPPQVLADPPSRVIWDHRAVGERLELRWLGTHARLPLGERGVYAFETAPWLARTSPELWRAAIAPLLPQPQDDRH